MMLATKLQEAAANSTLPTYIEDVFSTYLYTGNGSTQTITNGIDLSTKGGMVWIKSRSNATNHLLLDSARTPSYALFPDLTNAQSGSGSPAPTFTTTGFSVNSSQTMGANAYTYASWTFRKQPKFFDVVTYTGNGSAGRTVAHNLGSTPACIIVKCTSSSGAWTVYHRSTGSTKYLILNNTDAADTFTGMWNNTDPTATEFTLGASSFVNQSGQTFVAYLFAHNAGGFGLTGTDNVISCGSYSGTGSPVTVDLGFEPQWIMFKSATSADNWRINDVMRGIPTGGTDANLAADLSNAEYGSDDRVDVTSTGFIAKAANSQSGVTHIYIAIRRGPMKVPTSGTSVFHSASFSDNNSSFSTGFVTDFAINKVTYYNPDLGTYTDGTNYMLSRLTANRTLATNQGTTESNLDPSNFWDIQDGYRWANGSGYSIFGWAFARAPSFADVVCYTGTSPTVNTVTHNLGAVPELMFVKLRTGVNRDWAVYSKAYSDYLGLQNRYGQLNTTVSLLQTSTDVWNNTAPTATSFQVNATDTNYNGGSLIAYLFATCAGVSKCGLFTGTGATQTIDCGFTGGARFVMIKRANTTGDWFVYDSSRGIQSGNDPYLRFNSSLPAVTNTNYVDAAATGFQVIGSGLNVSGGIYIFLAIA